MSFIWLRGPGGIAFLLRHAGNNAHVDVVTSPDNVHVGVHIGRRANDADCNLQQKGPLAKSSLLDTESLEEVSSQDLEGTFRSVFFSCGSTLGVLGKRDVSLKTRAGESSGGIFMILLLGSLMLTPFCLALSSKLIFES